MKLVVSGWRFLPHSYSVVCHHVCLELLRRRDVELRFEDAPMYKPSWRRVELDLPARMAALAAIPPPDGDAEVLLRICSPFDLSASAARRTAAHVTCEATRVFDHAMKGGAPAHQEFARAEALLLTPSGWSRQGLVNTGADPARIRLWPHGVDPTMLHPAPDDVRRDLRRALGLEGFVFLHIGAMTLNKGVGVLLRAFASVAARNPQCRLFLKGSDALYPSRDFLVAQVGAALSPRELEIVGPRLVYHGEPASFVDMARLYQAADAYVTPYLAEGFNMPALEALACGLPLVCTGGGATDDFADDDVALRVRSRLAPMNATDGALGRHVEFEHLVELMRMTVEDPSVRARARTAGPDRVAGAYTWRHVVDRLLSILGEA